jgi:electron transfer flavoprotein alpha subunit
MGGIRVHPEKINSTAGLEALCPFGAIVLNAQGDIEITAACKVCKICVRKGPEGVFEFVESQAAELDRSAWNGVLVYVEHGKEGIHPVTFELIGKAREMADKTGQPVYAIFAGKDNGAAAQELLFYGVDEVFVYDAPELEYFRIEPYAAVFCDLIEKKKPSTVLVGGTTIGRSLAPRVAARLRTGLTADCTSLDVQPNTDLDQIRPAFGGNIMAHIRTPNTRPQFATVRPKIFSSPQRLAQPGGKITFCQVSAEELVSRIQVLDVRDKPRVVGIDQADVIVAAGRGVRQEKDLALIQELAQQLGGVVAATRPLIEAGWVDPRAQIGLSGRTVRPRLIITCGISGAIQFVAGMQGAECIVAINSDPAASIFKVANVAIVGDLYEIVPRLADKLR